MSAELFNSKPMPHRNTQCVNGTVNGTSMGFTVYIEVI